MIRVLIIDDSSEKINVVRRFLQEECNVNSTFIDECQTIKDGRRILYEKDYDLLLLDLVMPRDSESEPSADESIKFLNEIYYNSSIKIPVHIIGFSQYDNLIQSHNDTFEDKLWHLINFSFTSNSWKDKLKNKICHLISVRNRFESSFELKDKFDIGIVCALDSPELKAVLDIPCHWKPFELDNDPMVYHEGTIDTINGNSFRIIACSVNKMGMQATAAVTSIIIAKFKVKHIFMTGICAGIQGKGLNLGDIIVAENLIDYGSGKMTEDEKGDFVFKPEPHQIPTDQNLIARINNFIRNNKELLKIQSEYNGEEPTNVLKVKVGPVASGSYVVASRSLVADITEPNRKMLGIDMEGYGLYLACRYFSNVKVLFIKSICDFADLSKDDKFQRYASYTSAKFLYSFLFNNF